jgi:putative solute:sodium symporter small subunit
MSAHAPHTEPAFSKQKRHWIRVRRLTLSLLTLWFAVNVGVIFFARELASLTLWGWPVPFYMAAQGTTLIYLFIIGIYAQVMNRLEQRARDEDAHGID